MYFQSPAPITNASHPGIFIAGGISNCPNWQDDIASVVDQEHYNVFNPRREGDLAKVGDEAKVQITWEFHAFEAAEIVLFWFPAESVCPITLFEYGKMLVEAENCRLRRIIVGYDPNYPRAFDLVVQTELMRLPSKVVLVEGYDKFKETVAAEYGRG